MTLNMFLVLGLMVSVSCKSLKKAKTSNGIGDTLYTLGGVVNVQVLDTGASYVSDIYWKVEGGARQALGLTSKDNGKSATLGNLPAAKELIFEIYVRDTKQTYQSGAANRNTDNIAHARVNQVNGAWEVRFEDIHGGGDKNYNDANLRITGYVDNKRPAAYPQFELGGQLWSTGNEDIWVDILDSSASYTNTFSLTGVKNAFGTNKQAGTSVNIGRVPAGQELVWGISVKDTNQNFLSGAASRNGDNLVHARIGQTGPNQFEVRFEDIVGGGDKDYNDANIRVRGGVTNVPPPVVGGRIWSTGGSIRVKILESSASYTSKISLGETPIGTNKDVNKVVELNIPAGEELVFDILVTDTGKRYFVGGAHRNTVDNLVHATTQRTPEGIRVGFEDIQGGGDKDYNDATILVWGAVTCERPVNPSNGIGSQLWTVGGEVTVTILSSDAGYTSNVSVTHPVTKSVGTNRETNKKVVIGQFAAGEELRLAIDVNDTGKRWSTGGAHRNSDKLAHSKVTKNTDGSYNVGFEDLENGGDKDYNDVIVRVTGVQA